MKTIHSNQTEITAPLAIDFGAGNTGVVSLSYVSGNLLNEADTVKKGYVFKIGEIQFSQRNRLAKRHQRRAFKRRKLARRLIFLILRDYFKIDNIKPQTKIFIQSLLRRRGFTYFTEELDESVIESADREFLFEFFPEIFSEKLKESALIQLLDIATDQERLQKSLNAKWYLEGKKSFEKLLKEKLPDADKEIIKSYSDTYDQIHKYIESVNRSKIEGHKTRKAYFESIREDIKNDWNLYPELHAKEPFRLTAEGFANLIGNISNLQLKVLRKYFNTPADPKTKEIKESPDTFYPEKLGIKVRKWVRSWHIDKDSEEIVNQKEVYQILKGNEGNIVKIFTETDPVKTIPPYEDMNNRRIPECQSMILDPASLNRLYPDWREWTHSLSKEFDKEWVAESGIEGFGIFYNSDNRMNGSAKNPKISKEEKDQIRDAVILQRLLDISVFLDPFKLRWQGTEIGRNLTKKERQKLNEGKDLLKKILGEEAAADFTEFLKDYYEQIREIRMGLELNTETSIFKVCGCKTKKKSNLTEILIKGIFQVSRFEKEDLNLFIEKVWKDKFSGNQSLRSFCANAEELRDSDGILFAQTVKRVAFKLKKHSENQASEESNTAKASKKKKSAGAFPDDLSDHEKEVAKLLKLLPQAVNKIAAFFPGLTKAIAERRGKPAEELRPDDFPFGNLFSMSQLYNIIEKDRGGYTKTCPACTAENNWRGTIVRHVKNSDTGAAASRLSGDVVRPFDGVVKRLCDRFAIEISRVKVRELINNEITSDRSTPLNIPLLIEQNQFEFHLDLGKIKKDFGIDSKKAVKKAGDRKKRILKSESEKEKRIKDASKNISPLSGEPIGEHGEIDHIIPRSLSRDMASTVYNSEMNLIYMSQSDNRKKGNRELSLGDLHRSYLQAQFGTSDIQTIKNRINEQLDKIEKQRRKVFHSYTEEEQIALRHSLFDPELRKRSMEYLNTATMAMANGTQKYFARMLQRELKKNLEKEGYTDFSIPIHFVTAAETQSDRKELAKVYKEYEKEKLQSAGSHIIDAAMVLSSAARTTSGTSALKSSVDLSENKPLADSLKELLPDSIEIITIEKTKKYRKKNLGSTPIFKEGIYGERIVPLFLNEGKLHIGFGPGNGFAVGSNEEKFFEVVRPYLYLPEKKLEDYKKEAGKGFLRIPFVRARVIHTLFHMIKEKNTDNDAFRILQGLRYTVQKTPVQKRLADENKPVSAEKVLNVKDFRINIDIPELECNGNKKLKDSELIYPAKADWERLMKDPLIQEKISTQEKYSDADWEEIIKRNFPVPERTRRHAGVRKVFSLPTIKSPSGGFRFKRKTFSGGNVYQLGEIDGNSAAGFAGKDENVLLNDANAVSIPALNKSKNLASVEVSEASIAEGITFMDEWREVSADNFKNIQRMLIMPNSLPRAKIMITIPFASLAKVLDGKADLYSLPSEIPKFGNADNINFLSSEFGLGVVSRDGKARLRSADSESVTLEFIVQSTNNELRELYKKGKPVKL